jgi:hypothetical protein
MVGIGPKWLMMPEVVAAGLNANPTGRVLNYPGIKKTFTFRSSSQSLDYERNLGVYPNQIMVTIRPPASDAHYHNPASDELFSPYCRISQPG